MPTIKTIDPVTRLEGHLKIDVTVDFVNGVQQVVDAKATGTLFRGFESLLVNRQPWDAQHITQRICGVCPVAHGLAAVLALESAAKTTIPNNARLMRNIVLGANFIQSHILHFYHLTLPDFIDGPNMPPWQPSWSADKRLSQADNDTLVSHYIQALEMRRMAHEMGALFGGRMPDPPTLIPGGFTTTPRQERIVSAKNYVDKLIAFINNVYIPDVQFLAAAYDDYYDIGKGHGNLISYGAMSSLFKRGRILSSSNTVVRTLDIPRITEDVTYSWYTDNTNGLAPAAGVTNPVYPKAKGYSWLKAPRYGGLPYEAGALARMSVNGDYKGGVSVMDRHLAKAFEALKVAQNVKQWILVLAPKGAVVTTSTLPASAISFGLTEAPRGAIGHWVQITNGVISKYQIITPTCWNASPKDSRGVRGPIEQALIGTPVANIDEPAEVVRVIHSFDPCLSCAVHVMRPSAGSTIVNLGHYHGEDEIYTHDHSDGHSHSHEHDHVEHSHE